MELNKIIRRSGITSSEIYSKFIADLTDALKDVTGITKEEVKENKDADGTLKENAHTRFYLGTSKKNYIKVVNNGNSGMRVQFTCAGTTIDIDGGSSTAPYHAYNIAKTAYGVMFTTLSHFSNATNIASDGTFQCYVTTFKDESNKSVNGFVFPIRESNITDGVDYRDWIYFASESHTVLEMQRGLFQMIGISGDQTVMYNASSYTHQLVAEHLFKKIMSESGRFGKIKLDGREFISGSHFCLECKT